MNIFMTMEFPMKLVRITKQMIWIVSHWVFVRLAILKR